MAIPMAEFEASDEVVLLRQAASGSRDAFEQLVRMHQAAVRWFLVRGVRDPAAADDLAQEVFLAAYQNLAACRGEAGLRGWLLGIARNMAVQHVRGETRRRARERGPLATKMAQWRMEQLEQDSEEGQEHESELAACEVVSNSCRPKAATSWKNTIFNVSRPKQLPGNRAGRQGA